MLLPLGASWGQKSDVDAPPGESKEVTDFNEIGERLALLSQDDDVKKNEARDKSRATAERFEQHVKDLVEKLTKELGPVGEELRKILERSIDEFHETLKKDDVTADDLRKALEKTHDDLRKAFEKGGTVNKELRESVEKSRRDLREEWERRAKNTLGHA